jgi:hypothetical protein
MLNALTPMSVTATLCVLLCGCSKSSKPPQIQTLPVTGTVTLDDKPLAGAMVVFMMADPPLAFSGKTKEDGSYQLEGLTGSAACTGPCKVTVTRKLKPDGSPVTPDEPPAISHAVESLPIMYTMLQSTPLSADVPDGGGKFDFPLKSK